MQPHPTRNDMTAANVSLKAIYQNAGSWASLFRSAGLVRRVMDMLGHSKHCNKTAMPDVASAASGAGARPTRVPRLRESFSV